MFASIEFLYPYFLYTFSAALLFFVVWFFTAPKATFWRYANIFAKTSGQRKWILWVSHLFTLISFGLFCILLARPVLYHTVQNTTQKGVDIIFVLDISKSMITEDITPNRIEAAKKVMQEFVSRSQGNRLGVVIFAGKPFLLSPPTFDKSSLLRIISTLTTDSINQRIPWLSGTAMGDGVLLALSSLGDLQDGKDREKIIVLLTDGEANLGLSPTVAGKYAADKKIKIYALWIGSPTGSELFYTDASGQKVFFPDANGNPLISKVDEKTLKQLAQDTSGAYFIAQDTKMLDGVFRSLSKEKMGEVQIKESRQVFSQEQKVVSALILSLAFLIFWRVRYRLFSLF